MFEIPWKSLISLNIDFDVCDMVEITPLHEVCKNGQVEVIFQENDTFSVISNHCEDPLEIHLLFTICILWYETFKIGPFFSTMEP